jgi:hypothetical protein
LFGVKNVVKKKGQDGCSVHIEGARRYQPFPKGHRLQARGAGPAGCPFDQRDYLNLEICWRETLGRTAIYRFPALHIGTYALQRTTQLRA